MHPVRHRRLALKVSVGYVRRCRQNGESDRYPPKSTRFLPINRSIPGGRRVRRLLGRDKLVQDQNAMRLRSIGSVAERRQLMT